MSKDESVLAYARHVHLNVPNSLFSVAVRAMAIALPILILWSAFLAVAYVATRATRTLLIEYGIKYLPTISESWFAVVRDHENLIWIVWIIGSAVALGGSWAAVSKARNRGIGAIAFFYAASCLIILILSMLTAAILLMPFDGLRTLGPLTE